MQQTWLVQDEGNQDLIIYMLGWAASPNAICHITPAGYDVLACYNYTAVVPLSAEAFSRYRRIYHTLGRINLPKNHFLMDW